MKECAARTSQYHIALHNTEAASHFHVISSLSFPAVATAQCLLQKAAPDMQFVFSVLLA